MVLSIINSKKLFIQFNTNNIYHTYIYESFNLLFTRRNKTKYV